MHGIATLMPWNMFITANSVSETNHNVLILDIAIKDVRACVRAGVCVRFDNIAMNDPAMY